MEGTGRGGELQPVNRRGETPQRPGCWTPTSPHKPTCLLSLRSPRLPPESQTASPEAQAPPPPSRPTSASGTENSQTMQRPRIATNNTKREQSRGPAMALTAVCTSSGREINPLYRQLALDNSGGEEPDQHMGDWMGTPEKSLPLPNLSWEPVLSSDAKVQGRTDMGVAKPDELGLLQMGGRTGIYRIQKRTPKSARILAQKNQKTQGQKSTGCPRTLPQQKGYMVRMN